MSTTSREAEKTNHEKVPRLYCMAGSACAWVLPVATQFFDYRVGHYDLANDPARPEYDEHCVYVFWHEYITAVLPKWGCLLYTSPSPRDQRGSRMPSSA